jgi:hypothetical protein
MKIDVVHVRAMAGHRLEVELADGRRGVFDLRPHLDRPGLRALRDEQYFARAGTLCGAVTWPDGEDIAPETLVAELQLTQPA